VYGMWGRKVRGTDSEPPDLALSYGLDALGNVELSEMHQIINARRMQWDNLLWQVPLISITGESFLFTIILNSATSHPAREIACGLAMIISAASLATLARHRLSEVHDANLLAGIERLRFKVAIHGPGYKDIRKGFRATYGNTRDLWDFIIRSSNRGRAYPIWVAVFIVFILVALGCAIADLAKPDFFSLR